MIEIEDYYYLPVWIWIIVSIIIILNIIVGLFFGIISSMISLSCGFKCSDWAKQIKSNRTMAFFIGFLFLLIGLLGYWIYYKIKKKKLSC